MVNRKWAFAVVIAAAVFGAFTLFPSEETKVKKQFSLLAAYACKEEGEKILTMAEKMRNLEFLFSEPCEIEAPPYLLSGSLKRAEIAGLAARARLHFSHLTMEFHDLSLSFPEEGTARAVVTGKVNGETISGEAVHEVREIECILKKSQDQWLFERWGIVEILKR